MTLVKIHLYCSGIALVFMCLMALSGSLHLLVGGESEQSAIVKEVVLDRELDKKELTELFSQELKGIDPNYKYSYIKGSSSSQTSRPTTRKFYTIRVKGDHATLERHEPSFRKSLMELHKGHGVKSSRTVLGVFGIFVIAAVLSGLWLGWSSKALRGTTVFTALSGALIYFAFLFL